MAARRPSEHLRRSMPVDGGSSSTLGGVVGRKGSTPEHSAWSRELYLSAATSFTVGRRRKIYCAALGSGRPERLRSHLETLLTRYRIPILARFSQKLSRIRANGFMVYRLGVRCWRDAGSCRLQRFSLKSLREKGGRTFLGRFQSIRRSRGAIGRYQGPRGAVPMTTGLPRRRGRLRRRLPG